MPRNAQIANSLARRIAPDPNLSMPPPHIDVGAVLCAAELGGCLSLDWSLERWLDRIEGRN
jgi:hypothetical protein